jgi:hypothetical protein
MERLRRILAEEGLVTAGKTWRRSPQKLHRRPGGQKHIYDPETRPGAKPPGTYEDIPHSKDVWSAQKAAERMREKGMSDEQILQALRRKWKLDVKSAWGIIGRL